MATKQTTLIGREIVIDFHGWDFERVAGQTRAEKVASICEHGQGSYRVAKERDGHKGEIVSQGDEGYRVLFEDGKLGDVHEMFFFCVAQETGTQRLEIPCRERKHWRGWAELGHLGQGRLGTCHRKFDWRNGRLHFQTTSLTNRASPVFCPSFPMNANNALQRAIAFRNASLSHNVTATARRHMRANMRLFARDWKALSGPERRARALARWHDRVACLA